MGKRSNMLAGMGIGALGTAAAANGDAAGASSGSASSGSAGRPIAVEIATSSCFSPLGYHVSGTRYIHFSSAFSCTYAAVGGRVLRTLSETLKGYKLFMAVPGAHRSSQAATDLLRTPPFGRGSQVVPFRLRLSPPLDSIQLQFLIYLCEVPASAGKILPIVAGE